MKKNIIIKSIGIMLIGGLAIHNLQAQNWEVNWQTISEQANIKFLDANVGYASSGNYLQIPTYLLKTTNGGLDWAKQVIDTASYIPAIDFLNPDYGFVCLENRSIAKTTNGGSSWTKSDFTNLEAFKDIQILNSQIIYALSTNAFHISTDAGSSWTNQTMPQVNKMHFVDANLGFVLTSTGIIRKTTNAGQSWQDLPTNATQPLVNLHFLNGLHGYVCGDKGLIMHTTNGGTSWTNQTTPMVWTYLYKIHFLDVNNGYAVGGKNFAGLILRTTNGGMSWQQQFNQGSMLTDISLIDANTLYGFGMDGALVKTNNQGVNWQRLSGFYSGTPIHDIHFPSARTGYLLSGGYPGENQDFIYMSKTTNGGNTWLTMPFGSPAQSVLKTVFFTDSLSGYVGGHGGQILHTTNGGGSWQPQNTNAATDTIERIHFVSSASGFAIGGRIGNSLLLRTTNAGTSWLPQTLPVTNRYLRAIWFVSPTIGYISGQDQLILKTTNGGQSWASQILNGTGMLRSIWFKDQNTGFATSERGTIWKTTNAGQSWQENNLNDGFVQLKDIKCIDNNCYAVGNSTLFNTLVPLMFTSTNMGQDWTRLSNLDQIYSYFDNYEKIYFAPSNKAYLLGNYNYFFETNGGVGTSVFKPIDNTKSLSFDIYPNPSSDGRFSISHAYLGKSKLTITNAQGQIISSITLDKPKLDVKLSTGLYFVRLENKQGSGTQKLIVY